MELKWASTRKCLSSTFFWDWLGVKCREKTGQGLLPFNFKYIPKAEKLYFLFFFLEVALPSLGGESQLKALPWWMWDGGRNTFIFFIYLFLPVRTWGKQQSRGRVAACVQATRALFPPNPFSQHQQDQHRRYAIESAMQMPSNVCFIPEHESEQCQSLISCISW